MCSRRLRNVYNIHSDPQLQTWKCSLRIPKLSPTSHSTHLPFLPFAFHWEIYLAQKVTEQIRSTSTHPVLSKRLSEGLPAWLCWSWALCKIACAGLRIWVLKSAIFKPWALKHISCPPRRAGNQYKCVDNFTSPISYFCYYFFLTKQG